MFNKSYLAEDVFGASLNQAVLYNNLLSKIGGDRSVVDKLIDLERQRLSDATRYIWIKDAIERWENDNQRFGQSQ